MAPSAQAMSEVGDANDVEVDLNGVPNDGEPNDVEAIKSCPDPDSRLDDTEDDFEPVSACLKIRSAKLCLGTVSD